MANLKLVGAVAIKVRPDATGFRKETQAEVDRELAGVDAKVEVEVHADTRPAKAEAEAAKEEIEKNGLKLRVGVDIESVQRAQRQLDAAVKRSLEEVIVVHLDDDGSIQRAQDRLDQLRAAPARVDIDFVPDEQGFREVLARIAEIKRNNIIKEHIDIDFDEASLDAKTAEIQARLDAFKPAATIKLSYNNNRASLEKAIAEIDAALADIDAVKIDVKLDPAQLAAKRAELDAQLGKLPVRIEYDDNLAGLRELKAKIEAFLGIDKLHIETTLDEAALRGHLAIVEAKIKEAEQNKLNIKVGLNDFSYAKTLAALKLLGKNMTVTLFVKMNNLGVLLAAAKLTGLRAASRWTEEFARSLGTLDRNLPIVAGAVLLLSTLSSGIVSLTADVFSLGNGLGEVARMAGLLAPAMILGLGASMIVLKGVFKDFGAAVNGDTKALAKLTPAGQEAAKGIRTVFQDIRETISKNFWDEAGSAMNRFVKTALPAVGDGLGKLSKSLAGIFGHLLDSFTTLAKQDGIKVFFTNLTHGFDVAQTGLSLFMDAFNTLAVVGSTAFPKIGRAFNAFADDFNRWVQRIAADGTLSRWIDIGVQGLKDLARIAGGLGKIWANVGQAAQAAGAVTLHSFAASLDRLDAITAGSRFQQNMKNIFQGARDASTSFHKSLGDLGPAMDVFSQTIQHTLVNAAGALGAFIRDLGDIFSSPLLDTGMTAFLTGVKSMFESLRPAAGAVATILSTFGQILGKVATDSGPLFRNLFQQLATVLTAAWSALEPFLPGLIQLGTTVVDILGPALASVAQVALPAFADGILQLGNGLLPAIGLLTDITVAAVGFLSALPAPALLGIAAAVVSLGAAFGVARAVAPLAAAALEAFGIAAGTAGARMQLMVPVLGVFLAAAAGLAVAGIGTLASAQQAAAPFANEYEAALRKDAEALGLYVGAIGEATRAQELKNAAESGAFDAAKNLGISVETYTDALFGQKKAQEEVNAVIDDARKKYDEARSAQKKLAGNGLLFPGLTPEAPEALKNGARDADILDKNLKQTSASLDVAIAHMNQLDQANKHAGISTGQVSAAQSGLAAQAGKTSAALGAAAAASSVLNDTLSSTPAKIDAMRKTFAILLPPNVKEQLAESLGAYAKSLQDIRDTAIPLAGQMQKLGEKIYGETGFLNVATGNKAVLALNQALVDEVNNVWAGAKAAYDAAIQQGKTAEQAFAISKKFIDDHHGDYNALADESGAASKRVQGQWEAIFGHEWVLKISLSGLTETAAQAQSMLASIGAQFDGKEFTAYFNANPDEALKAASDAKGAAADFVNHHWETKLHALPKPAQDTIKALVNVTEEQWNNGNFQAILTAAKNIPGLAEALLKINNGVKDPFIAQFFASLDIGSLGYVQARLDALSNQKRYVHYGVTIDDIQRDQVLAGRGGRNGAIVDGFGRGLAGFNMERVKFFANGGIENHIAQISSPNGPLRIWGERETFGEAYIPLSSAKRPRSVQILGEVARRFGYQLSKAQQFAGGGIAGGNTTSHTSADVHIGSITTVDMQSAVASLRQSQRDALAVAGISSIGV